MLKYNSDDNSFTKIPELGSDSHNTFNSNSDRRYKGALVAPTDDLADYNALRSRIVIAAEEYVKSRNKLGELLLEMKDSELWKKRFTTWNDFCSSLYVQGFQGYTGRRANQLIAHVKEVAFLTEAIAPMGTAVPELQELNEATTRELGRLPEEKRVEVVTQLVKDQQETGEKPTGPRVKALAKKKDEVPVLARLKELWDSVGVVTPSTKYRSGFSVSVCTDLDNPELTESYEVWDFQTREEAWKIWEKHGYKYRDQIVQHRNEKASEGREAALDQSCFECKHHEREGEGFSCGARSFTMSASDDYGPGCSQWKSSASKGLSVAPFSMKEHDWARPSRIETPFASKLEELKLLLRSLAEERQKVEALPLDESSGLSTAIAAQLNDFGLALDELIEDHRCRYNQRNSKKAA